MPLGTTPYTVTCCPWCPRWMPVEMLTKESREGWNEKEWRHSLHLWLDSCLVSSSTTMWVNAAFLITQHSHHIIAYTLPQTHCKYSCIGPPYTCYNIGIVLTSLAVLQPKQTKESASLHYHEEFCSETSKLQFCLAANKTDNETGVIKSTSGNISKQHSSN